MRYRVHCLHLIVHVPRFLRGTESIEAVLCAAQVIGVVVTTKFPCNLKQMPYILYNKG